MDLGTILTATVMLAICIIPFTILYTKRKKRSKQLLDNFKSLFSQKGLNIGEYETCGDCIIGFDSASSEMFFIKQTKGTDLQMSVPINTISDCKVEKIYVSDQSTMNNLIALDKVILKLTTKDVKSDSTIVLFDNCTQAHLDDEIHFGERWSKKIKAAM